ncbi:MAG TPA: endolytic transglycosylase MltG [Candidatus Moranbacteria bacterium]|nr:MAG: Aminodeoxychorismate lyase [Candidatus Moranbacteria bacterium GW2011_GWF1_34_10]HBI16540.1 endolytic transglycosylase MltG [Candidatus Moranbacteria bacterium]
MYKKIGIIILAIGVVFSAIFLMKDKRETGKVVNFEVKKGENIWNTASNLEKEGLIGNKIYFVWYVYKNDYRGRIKAGKYILNSDLKVLEIVMILAEGDKNDEKQSKKITFPEGFSLKQMGERLGENGFDKDKFLELTKKPQYFKDKYQMSFLGDIPANMDLEGYLFPDTYFFFVDEDEEHIIKKMLENFEEKFSSDMQTEIKRQGKNISEIMTMASIIEKEVRTPEDKKIVSGIFYNRKDSGQAFQSCATLAFIIGENKKQYSYEDTQIKSPYNTYLNSGLPPGPISNPGLDSILAAIYPAKTDYVYFLNNPETGKTIFSVTLDEHNLNKDRNGL